MQNMHNEKKEISCAIFAGGQNKRMGRHKAFLEHEGKKFIEVIYDKMKAWFDEVFIITNDKRLFPIEHVPVFEDIIPGIGPLGALHTALTVAGSERVFCIACDMPDPCDALIRKIIMASQADAFDCFVPRETFGLQPLFAIYKKTMKDFVQKEIAAGQLSISVVLEKSRAYYLDMDEKEEELININTPEEYIKYEVRSKVWFEKDGKLVFGKGKSEIFKLIQEHQSINEAARRMNISFRHAWGYINGIEKRLGVNLVERTKGGKGGGGSKLTDYARELMARYDSLKEDVDNYTDKKVKEVFGGWKNMRSTGSFPEQKKK